MTKTTKTTRAWGGAALICGALIQLSGCSYIAHSGPVRGGHEDSFCTPSRAPHNADAAAALLAPLAGLAVGLLVDADDDAQWAPLTGFVAGGVIAGTVAAPAYRHGVREAAACRAARLARDRAWTEYWAAQDSTGGSPEGLR